MNAGERRAVVYGLVVTAGFVAIDLASSGVSISGSYGLGAIVAGVLAGFRPALALAVLAVLLAALSGVWNHDVGDLGYFLRLFVASAGGLLALGAGRLREENEGALEREQRAEGAQRLLSDAGAVLASSLDYAGTIQRVAELAVTALADWCTVTIRNGDALEHVAAAHKYPAKAELARSYARHWPTSADAPTISAEVLRTGAARVVPELTDAMLDALGLPVAQRQELALLGADSIIVVPMATAERTVGVLTLVAAESQRRFGDDDLELALELGRRAATAIENSRLYTELEQIATTLQASLLPPALPEVPGWRFASLYLQAGAQAQVGGDFYDVFPTAAGWMAVMGDVVGRGPAAASLTAMGRYTLRTAGSLVGTPTMGLARLNDHLRARGDTALCTAVVVLLREGSDEASLVCAGHPLPYLIRDGQVQAVGRTGPLLGAFDHGQWLPETLDMRTGDVLVLYTDGVLDAGGSGERFGEARLVDALAGTGSADDAVARIHAALVEFAGDEQDDDTAVLALQKL